jgi:ABC-type dipeptide/oligopeptide/nickel transport system permease component
MEQFLKEVFASIKASTWLRAAVMLSLYIFIAPMSFWAGLFLYALALALFLLGHGIAEVHNKDLNEQMEQTAHILQTLESAVAVSTEQQALIEAIRGDEAMTKPKPKVWLV